MGEEALPSQVASQAVEFCNICCTNDRRLYWNVFVRDQTRVMMNTPACVTHHHTAGRRLAIYIYTTVKSLQCDFPNATHCTDIQDFNLWTTIYRCKLATWTICDLHSLATICMGVCWCSVEMEQNQRVSTDVQQILNTQSQFDLL